ncbi:MAG: ATP-binding protein [bacterium]
MNGSKRRHEQTILVGFGFALVILLLVGIMYYRTTTKLWEPESWRFTGSETLLTLQSIRSELHEIEGSEFGFLLTRDGFFLQQNKGSYATAERKIQQLRSLDTLKQLQKNLDKLESFLQERKKFLSLRAELFKSGKDPGVSAPMAADAEKTLTAEVLPLIAEMESDERNQLRLHENEVRNATRASFRIIGLGGVLVFVLLVISGIIIYRQIIQRQAAETELRSTEGLFSSMVENIPAMIFLKDAKELRFVLFNKAGEELLGYSREELLGKNDYDFFPKDQADFFTAKDREVLTRNTVVDVPEETIETKARGSCILHTRKIPLRNAAGEPQYLLGISEDITERKQSEDRINMLHKDLEQRALDLEDVNKELEAFSYSVSHDLRAPLRHIDGFVDLLQKQTGCSLDVQSDRYLNIIADAAKHMGILVDELLVFSRMGRSGLEKTKISMGALVREALHDLQPGIEGRNIVWKIGELADVYGDPLMVRLALVNLLSNALKYTGPRAEVRIEIGCWAQGDEAVFFVRDNGVGFDMQYVDKLFGVFQRLHRAEDFEGTGIGLANVRRIITRHGGKTWAEGAVDKGATFYFTFPVNAKG